MLTPEEALNPLAAGFDPTNPFWAALSIEERMKMMHLAQLEAIENLGYTIVAVGSSVDDPLEFPFAYTVGGDVSLILTGMNVSAQPLIDDVHPFLSTHEIGVPWEISNRVEAVVVFAPVPDRRFRELCSQAIAHGAKSAVQVIWQNPEGFWPWEPEHLHQTHGGADVLAGDDWRPNE